MQAAIFLGGMAAFFSLRAAFHYLTKKQALRDFGCVALAYALLKLLEIL